MWHRFSTGGPHAAPARPVHVAPVRNRWTAMWHRFVTGGSTAASVFNACPRAAAAPNPAAHERPARSSGHTDGTVKPRSWRAATGPRSPLLHLGCIAERISPNQCPRTGQRMLPPYTSAGEAGSFVRLSLQYPHGHSTCSRGQSKSDRWRSMAYARAVVNGRAVRNAAARRHTSVHDDTPILPRQDRAVVRPEANGFGFRSPFGRMTRVRGPCHVPRSRGGTVYSELPATRCASGPVTA